VTRKKLKNGILTVTAILLLGIAAITVARVVEYNQISYQRTFPENQGVISNIPIPKGSRPVGPYAVNGEKIETFVRRMRSRRFIRIIFVRCLR